MNDEYISIKTASVIDLSGVYSLSLKMEGSYGSKYGLGAIPEEGNSVSVYMCKHAIVRVHKNGIVSVHLCLEC